MTTWGYIFVPLADKSVLSTSQKEKTKEPIANSLCLFYFIIRLEERLGKLEKGKLHTSSSSKLDIRFLVKHDVSGIMQRLKKVGNHIRYKVVNFNQDLAQVHLE
mmetsp:Transcript_2903/g.6461  ORF Transcript_2903/g.6461 Transcript_2903/m.6461 type:complete len:104 (+) Transcript_2903:50-361(+)